MPAHSPYLGTDRPTPLAFLMPAGLIGGIVWLYVLLAQIMPQ